ncbi:NAD(P)H-binding protein [Paenalkalicoccus suaedae]|uniref:NAD(P)H-binding protein n=1 Tax=Paenalkalicoccus suaedae TaxID=2592382 RepID=A0A859FJF6_9BACI|nr:NAD(P)H-binding protein [Paenalkalicoccus suaedae]QKS72932.1 NAD(P)H-binding protein [Paenalkalicoccus suaedae]
MKIAVFGASGRSGIPFVKQALEQGHELTVLVRTPSKLGVEHPHLTVLQGDILKESDVLKTIEGNDAVVSLIGHSKNSPKDLQATATSYVLKAMHTHEVTRLISLTGAAVKAQKDVAQKWFGRIIEGVMQLVAKDVLNDGKAHATLIAKSSVDWTIVRGPRLTEGPLTKDYKTGYFKMESPFVSRADIAHFILRELDNPTYIHEYPLISAK